MRAAAIGGKLMHCRRAPQSVARFWRYEALITITHLSQRPSILHVHRDVGNKIITQLFHSFFFLLLFSYDQELRLCARHFAAHESPPDKIRQQPYTTAPLILLRHKIRCKSWVAPKKQAYAQTIPWVNREQCTASHPYRKYLANVYKHPRLNCKIK